MDVVLLDLFTLNYVVTLVIALIAVCFVKFHKIQ